MKRALVLVVVLLLAGCGGGGGGDGGGGGGAGEFPPGNVVWFGASYDPTSVGLIGKATTLKAGGPMAAVARLFTPRSPGTVQVVISSGPTTRRPVPVGAGNNGDQSDVFGIDLTNAGLTPNTWIINFVDAQERILASGFLTVTP
jgi:hypothetical protein